MKDIFIGISDAIDTGVSAIRWIDFDLGQYEMEPPPVSWPAVLIGFPDASFENIGGGGQIAEFTVAIQVGFRLRERTHSVSASSFRDEALQHLDVLQEIHQAIDGLSGDCFKDLRRQSWSNEPRSDYRIYTLTYVGLFTDVPDDGYQNWADAGGEGDGPDFCTTNWDMVQPNE